MHETEYALLPYAFKHQRKAYGLFGFVSDLGGVSELLILVFGFFVFPYSEFSFNIKAMKKLFFVRTKNEDNFLNICEDHKDEEFDMKLPKESLKEINMHHKIKLKKKDACKLYFSRICGRGFRRFYDADKLNSMYEQGEVKLNEHLDVIQIVDKVRQFEILLENTRMISEQTKYLIKHAKQNWIDIESGSISNSDDSAELEFGNITGSDESIEKPRVFKAYQNNKRLKQNSRQRSRVTWSHSLKR